MDPKWEARAAKFKHNMDAVFPSIVLIGSTPAILRCMICGHDCFDPARDGDDHESPFEELLVLSHFQKEHHGVLTIPPGLKSAADLYEEGLCGCESCWGHYKKQVGEVKNGSPTLDG